MKLEPRAVIAALAAHYGKPEAPPSNRAFELVLYENVAYLAPPARRREAFGALVRDVGTTPDAILRATPRALAKVTSRGILPARFARKLRECARVVVEELDGDLDAALDRSPAEAKRTLRRFPGIGEPGADKILLFSGRAKTLAPESNALRVLARLGLIREDGSYAKTYAAARAVSEALPSTRKSLERAHLLLKLHGETSCKRSAPGCDDCPLVSACAYAKRAREPRGRRQSSGSLARRSEAGG